MAGRALNILVAGALDHEQLAGLRRYGHTLTVLSHDGFRDELFADLAADAVIADASPLGRQWTNKWLSAQKHCPPLILLGAPLPEGEARCLTLPPNVPASSLDGCLRLLHENCASQDRIEALEAAWDRDRRLMGQALQQFIPRHSLNDPALRYWKHNSDDIEGQLLLVARAPTGVLNVMMIRGSLMAFPVITPFYRMSEKGFSIDAILAEMNSRLLRLHPSGTSIPATLASVNFLTGTARVWNAGGGAPILLLRANSEVVISQRSHPSLGVADISADREPAEVWPVRDGDRLLLCSTGLQAALQAQSDSQLAARLDTLLASADTALNPLSSLPGTDKMLAVITCSPSLARTADRPVPVPARNRPLRSDEDSLERWRLALTIGPDEMRRVDVVPLLLGVVGQIGGLERHSGRVFLVLAELYNNALDHGVLRLDSQLKCAPDGMTAFLEERSRRLNGLTAGSIGITLAVESRGDCLDLWIACRDSGPGFDHRQVREHAAGNALNALPFGRGLMLLESEAAVLEFNDSGNEVRARLSLEPAPAQ